MSDTTTTDVPVDAGPVLARLSVLDRWLPAWIIAAMIVGLALGRFVPGLAQSLDAVQVGSVSVPIAIGLLVMMYPVLAKVRYTDTGHVLTDKRLMITSLVLNWVVGPGPDVLARLDVPARPARVPDRFDHRRPRPLHSHGADLERPGLWRPRGRRCAGGDQLRLPGDRLRCPRMVLPADAAVLARPPDDLGGVLHRHHHPQRARLSRHPPARRVPHPHHRGEAEGPGLVREHVPAEARTVRPLRVAVHHRDLVRAARPHHRRTATGRGPDRGAASHLLRRHLHHRHGRRPPPRSRLPPHHHARVHRGREQLRARHRRGDRHLRRHLRAGPRRCRRAPDRGARPRRPGLRRPLGPTVCCVHNAGRSQMAAGYLTHLAGERIDVRSAGSAPAASINPVAVAAMAEEGIDITGELPKILTTDAVRASDVVITMGCGDTCPFFPGKRYEDWVLDDPAGQGIDAVRPIRDEIRRRIEQLISEL